MVREGRFEQEHGVGVPVQHADVLALLEVPADTTLTRRRLLLLLLKAA